MATYPVSDHCDGERFFNPHATARPLRDVITWMRTRQKRAWPANVPLSPHPSPPWPVEPGRVAVTFIGHSTFLVRTASMVMLTDPVFTRHAGPFGRFGPPRVRPPAIAPSALPPVDLVLVSHNHYDHLQPSSLRRFAGTADFVTALGVGRQLDLPQVDLPQVDLPQVDLPQVDLPPKGGSYRNVKDDSYPVASAFRRKETRVHQLDWWQTTRAGAAEITCVPAQHFSSRTAWDRDRTLWCGFVVRVDGVTIYFAGDSGYSAQFAAIGERSPGIDVALLPIGAYEPRWFMSPVHMNPDEAVRAHRDLGARVSIGMHFGTFQLTDEAIDEPLRALEAGRVAHGVTPEAFRTLDFGASAIV